MKRHMITPARRPAPLEGNPLWYKDAIIYEARVRSFYDSNSDGYGDFRGLASKLDYLQDLGVTAIWLLPFYPSPMRDDGYDIADYTDVHPEVGTLADFEYFLGEAHARGLRVITELVLNHTSDQHPWFKRARRAPAGSVERDFYVWSDTIERYREARIIFKDFEPSNWSWDPVAAATSGTASTPPARSELREPRGARRAARGRRLLVRQGRRRAALDAVPYLYEREGTNCENLPRPTPSSRSCARTSTRVRRPHAAGEANQWPEDAAAYFGAATSAT
jgi:maltose alpha-D-glucosyltransferase/alpha-amylase